MSRNVPKPSRELVHEKTAGNPFFAIQFLTALAEEHLVEFDARKTAWQWDLTQIHTRDFTDNVVELMISKLRRLPAATQEALKQLACLGDNAKMATLAIVNGRDENAIHAASVGGRARRTRSQTSRLLQIPSRSGSGGRLFPHSAGSCEPRFTCA